MLTTLPAHVDVAICGGGPVGSALALGLRASGLSAAVLDERLPDAPRDARVIALAHGSRLILERLGVDWGLLDATPIERIHVSHRDAPGRVVLTAAECGVPALGYVTAYDRLCRAFDLAVAAAAIPRLAGTRVTHVSSTPAYAVVECERGNDTELVTARWVAIADGARGLALPAAFSATEHDYDQTALVTEIGSDAAHESTAYERFTRNGPLALLPFGERYSVVWTLPRAAADAWLARPDAEVVAALQGEIGDRPGRLRELGRRAAFPLRLRVVRPNSTRRIALVGNAAQSLHPVAGQGFNLGLRDAWTLARTLCAAPPDSRRDAEALARWRVRRRADRFGSVALTHGLVSVFGSEWRPLAQARAAGLALVDAVPPMRRWFARQMMFGRPM